MKIFHLFIIISIIFFIIIAAIFFINCSGGGRMNDEKSFKIADQAELIHPLLTGMKIPDIILETTASKKIDLNEAIRNKPTILIFYRGGWCPYCNIQLSEITKIEDDLIKLGFQIFAISPDKPEKLKESIIKHRMKYTLFSDTDMEAAKKFGLAFHVNKNITKKYKRFNIDLEGASGKSHNYLPVPAVFIIGKDEMIKFSYVNPNYKIRLHSDILMAAASAFSKEER